MDLQVLLLKKEILTFKTDLELLFPKLHLNLKDCAMDDVVWLPKAQVSIIFLIINVRVCIINSLDLSFHGLFQE